MQFVPQLVVLDPHSRQEICIVVTGEIGILSSFFNTANNLVQLCNKLRNDFSGHGFRLVFSMLKPPWRRLVLDSEIQNKELPHDAC